MSLNTSETQQLAGRVAVVTGGSSGVGRATAIMLAERGADVFVGDYDLLQENDLPFGELGIQQRHCNVRFESHVRQLIAMAADSAGGIDVLVNNAGIGMAKPITEVSEADWDACIDTNLKGAFFGCKHGIPMMRNRGGGTIINLASNAGILPRSYDPVYSISKGGLVYLTKSLALCHGPDRIRINAVCPGPVSATRMIDAVLDQAVDRQAVVNQLLDASPLARAHQRMTTPHEVAEAVLYLASDVSLMVTGTCIVIDGGKSLGVPPQPATTENRDESNLG